MKRRAYCSATRDLCEDYCARQNGGKIPVFAVRRFQRGHGLGNNTGRILSSTSGSQAHGKSMLANALKTGMEVEDDVDRFGRSLKQPAKRRVRRVENGRCRA